MERDLFHDFDDHELSKDGADQPLDDRLLCHPINEPQGQGSPLTHSPCPGASHDGIVWDCGLGLSTWANGNSSSVADQKPDSSQDALNVHFFEGSGVGVPSHEYPPPLNPVNAMTDEQLIMTVQDDIAGLQRFCLFDLQFITFLDRRKHTLGLHERGHDFLQDGALYRFR